MLIHLLNGILIHKFISLSKTMKNSLKNKFEKVHSSIFV